MALCLNIVLARGDDDTCGMDAVRRLRGQSHTVPLVTLRKARRTIRCRCAVTTGRPRGNFFSFNAHRNGHTTTRMTQRGVVVRSMSRRVILDPRASQTEEHIRSSPYPTRAGHIVLYAGNPKLTSLAAVGHPIPSRVLPLIPYDTCSRILAYSCVRTGCITFSQGTS